MAFKWLPNLHQMAPQWCGVASCSPWAVKTAWWPSCQLEIDWKQLVELLFHGNMSIFYFFGTVFIVDWHLFICDVTRMVRMSDVDTQNTQKLMLHHSDANETMLLQGQMYYQVWPRGGSIKLCILPLINVQTCSFNFSPWLSKEMVREN